MFILGQTLILLGFVLQLCNLIIDIRFINSKRHNVTENRRSQFLDFLIFSMVVLFFVVYLIIFFVKVQTVWVGILLFAGAILLQRFCSGLQHSQKKSGNRHFQGEQNITWSVVVAAVRWNFLDGDVVALQE